MQLCELAELQRRDGYPDAANKTLQIAHHRAIMARLDALLRLADLEFEFGQPEAATETLEMAIPQVYVIANRFCPDLSAMLFQLTVDRGQIELGERLVRVLENSALLCCSHLFCTCEAPRDHPLARLDNRDYVARECLKRWLLAAVGYHVLGREEDVDRLVGRVRELVWTDLLENESRRCMLLCDIAETWKYCGRREKMAEAVRSALNLAQTIVNRSERHRVQSSVADRISQLGFHDEAERSIRIIIYDLTGKYELPPEANRDSRSRQTPFLRQLRRRLEAIARRRQEGTP
jgi:hypothetical protein